MTGREGLEQRETVTDREGLRQTDSEGLRQTDREGLKETEKGCDR